jgi:hypothetical protein
VKADLGIVFPPAVAPDKSFGAHVALRSCKIIGTLEKLASLPCGKHRRNHRIDLPPIYEPI